MQKQLMTEEESFYLTCGQRWLLHLFEQAPDLARPVQRIYRLSNAFDSSAFVEALQCTVDVHPSLRLRLIETETGWKQYFPDREVEISGEEIQGRTQDMRAAYAGMLLAEEVKATLDLRIDPAIKVKIIKVDEEYLLSLCVDHIAADEFAFDLFEQALVMSYQQAIDGVSVSSTPSETFSAYLLKEAVLKHTEQNNLLYWQQQLENAPARADAEKEINWVPATFFHEQLTGSSFQLLMDFCKVNKCSLFNIVIAIQLLLLAEAGDVNDIVLNIPVSNRARASERFIIGNLSMLLHVRFAVYPKEPVSQLVIRVRDQILTAMAHRQYDYPSLSQLMVEKRNGVNWLLGCNFIPGHAALSFPNVLFEERLDNQPGRVYDIPQTSFTVVAHQTSSMLQINMEWDASSWPLSCDELQVMFHGILQRFTNAAETVA